MLFTAVLFYCVVWVLTMLFTVLFYCVVWVLTMSGFPAEYFLVKVGGGLAEMPTVLKSEKETVSGTIEPMVYQVCNIMC